MCFSWTSSPRSWLHSVEDLKLLSEQTLDQCHHPDLCERESESLEAETSSNIVQQRCSTADNEQRSATTECFTSKPLIRPARLKVRKRRFSISSATAALSLAGNGWSLGDHVAKKSSSYSLNDDGPRPFLSSGHSMNQRNKNNGQQTLSSTREGSSEGHHLDGRFRKNSGRFTNYRMNDTFRQDGIIRRTSSSGPSISDTNAVNYFKQASNQSQRMEDGASYVSRALPDPGNRVSCVVAALILLSVTANIVLLFLLFTYIYKPRMISDMVL